MGSKGLSALGGVQGQSPWPFLLLSLLTALRLAVSSASPMAPDEAYYWVWSKALAQGYLDHPPMVALWIRAGTSLLGDGNLGVRLLAPLAAALGTWLLVQAGRDLLGARAGLIAGTLMNATLLFGVGATTLTPDTPLLLFWTMTLWALARLLVTGNGLWWLVAGAAAGLALDSKYTAVLLAPSILAWVLAVPALRPWLRRWPFWAAALIALALFAPVLDWNMRHGFASFAKQGGRTADWDPSRAAQFLGELIGGQIGLATPLVALLCAAGMVLAARRARQRDPVWMLLACLTFIPGLVFVQHALGDRVQANWPVILYPAASIAAGGLTGRLSRWWRPAAAFGLALTALVWVQAIWTPVALRMERDPTLLRLGGWQSLADDIAQAARAEHAAFVVSDNYGHAALLARLLQADLPVLGAEGRWALFDLPDGHGVIAGQSGLLLRSARRADTPDPTPWAAITPLSFLTRARAGMAAEGFRLYRVTGRGGAPSGDAPVVVMPRPASGAPP